MRVGDGTGVNVAASGVGVGAGAGDVPVHPDTNNTVINTIVTSNSFLILSPVLLSFAYFSYLYYYGKDITLSNNLRFSWVVFAV